MSRDDLFRNEAVDVAFHVVREALFLAGSFWFYKGGPWIRNFFLQSQDQEKEKV